MFQMGRIGNKKGRVFKPNKLSKLDSLGYAIARIKSVSIVSSKCSSKLLLL